MHILSFFTDSGVPKTGLTPIINVRNALTGLLLVSGTNMNEVGDGFYNYNFTSYEYNADYAIMCDGGIVLDDTERYVYASNENYVEDINSVLNNNDNLKRILGLMHHNIYIDEPVYDDTNNLVQANVTIYSVAESVGTPNDIIGTYQLSSGGSGAGKFNYWKQLKIT